jgi:transcriptional regulator with XRE-family HTH domain
MPKYGATPDYKRRRKIAALRAKGLSYKAIAKRLGVSQQSIACMLDHDKRMNAREVKCKECGGVIARGRAANKTAQNTFCLACLAKHPKATFAERLRAHRVAAGLTRVELARRTGLMRGRVHAFETSRTGEALLRQVCRLIRVLGVGLLGLKSCPMASNGNDDNPA